MRNEIINTLDILLPKTNDYWIMPVYFIGDGDFVDNVFAVFEKIKNEKHIKKIILTRNTEINVTGKNTIIIPMSSYRAIYYLLRSNIIFVQHSLWLDLKEAKFQITNPRSRHIINLWHGIAPKDISHENTGIINERSLLEMPNYYHICSSNTDRKNKKKAFFGTPLENFWITGNPRCDFLKMEEKELPKSYQNQLGKLRKITKNNRLFVYAPTYRETDKNGGYYRFDSSELETLQRFLENNNIYFGVRYHIYRKPDFYKSFLKYPNIIDLSAEVISDFRIIMRVADVLVTDYSSVYVDALYLDKRCISFSYDLKHYSEVQRGFFADFETIFPGKICQNFEELLDSMHKAIEPMDKQEKEKYKKVRNILFQYNDANNAIRVIDKISHSFSLKGD